ncbi:MAG: hypothetical protein IJ740_18950 [Ruminococcus sp.]|nr:hypothetical protein [Ruminococcus sp.]MBR1752921.1 hypothetical protein [Ruminococcus sp.]
MKKVKVYLTPKSLQKAIDEIKTYKKWLLEKTQEFLDELGKQGVDIAHARFEKAEYDGTKDFAVSLETRDEKTVAIVAIGQSVLFLEFGTGVVYKDDHPEKPNGILARGTYGKGHGKQQTWGFYGDDKGSHGKYATTKLKTGEIVEKIPHVVLTHGNPANMCLYETRKELKEIILETAKRVYTR